MKGIWTNKKHNRDYQVHLIVSDTEAIEQLYVIYTLPDKEVNLGNPFFVKHTEENYVGLVYKNKVLWVEETKAASLFNIEVDKLDIYSKPLNLFHENFGKK
jgi:hypothetical protein